MLASAALAAHTGKLDLVIRHVLAGLGHGIHAGRERGAGVEFSEYRAYAPGRRVAPRRLEADGARRPLLSCARPSATATSRSGWCWTPPPRCWSRAAAINGLDKLGSRALLLGCVGAIAQRQGDAFGLVVCQGERAHFTPAARGPRQLQRVLAQLARQHNIVHYEARIEQPLQAVLRSWLRLAGARAK
jgi:uncharacterized protein (DUF58 family)